LLVAFEGLARGLNNARPGSELACDEVAPDWVLTAACLARGEQRGARNRSHSRTATGSASRNCQPTTGPRCPSWTTSAQNFPRTGRGPRRTLALLNAQPRPNWAA